MAQIEQAQHERIKHHVLLSFGGAALLGTVAGYLLFYGVQGGPVQFPAPLRAIYQAIKDLQEIFFALGSALLTELLGLLQISKSPDKFRKIVRKIQIMVILLSLALYAIVGYSIAEKGQESKQLASYAGESPSYLTPDEVDALELSCWIDIKILPSDIPDEQMIGYHVIDFRSADASLVECALNPLSAINHMIIGTKFVQYELILRPEETPNPGPCENVVVKIKEVLVQKDGEPLIELDSLDPQLISYGPSPTELEAEQILPSPEGYVISWPAAGTCYIEWDRELKRADGDCTACFEDRLMETNGPFPLTASSLKELLGDKLPQFSNTDLKAAIIEIGTSQEARSISLPLEMSTREGRILYHWHSSQDDFYFSINSLASGHRYIEREASDQSNYRLLCELSIE